MIDAVRVVASPAGSSRGLLRAGGQTVPCALGRNGVTARKREGDGATPSGRFPIGGVLYRPDRVPRPKTRLKVVAITEASGWCDDPADRLYNRPVKLPYPASHERLWREDRLYDLVVVLGYNMNPVKANAGSAIFLHVAHDDFSPTEGCVAVARDALARILTMLAPGAMIEIR